LETHLDVDSEEPEERIRELIRVGKQMCYTEQALMNPVPVLTYASLKGEDLQLDEINADYPVKQPGAEAGEA
jgi:hypothetical protein